MMVICKNCGTDNLATDESCLKCGAPLPHLYPTRSGRVKVPTSAACIAGFTLAIGSIATGFTMLIVAAVGLIFSIVGTVSVRKNCMNGFVFGIAGIVISSIIIVFYLIAFAL